uniref:Uncharacterized protein n=1 Tax=Arundo donax TaxID=35708 RepID=A0A0A9A0K5_ARUDO
MFSLSRLHSTAEPHRNDFYGSP